MRLNAIVAALTILLFSPAVLALSLGEATSHSHLNQPLKASIVVRAVKYDERDTIRAIIPDAEKFKRAGVRRDAIVENIQLDVSDGNAEDELLIHLSTEKRIKEPFVNFLVEVRWLGGSVTREYTILLDPAPVAASRQGSDDVSTRPIEDSAAQEFDSYSEPETTVSNPPTYASSGSREYGPVKRHETLWSIAFSQRRDPAITMDQMQLAIYQANPQAFDGNINQMRSGSMLTIPPDNEIRAIDESYAKREVRKQRSSYQPPAPAYVPPPSKPEPVYSPEPEPVAEVEPEPAPEPVIEAEPEPEMAATDTESEAAAAEADTAMQAAETTDQAESPPMAASEPPPAMASASATADGEALTEDELIAEGDDAEASSGDIEMPSVWVDEEEAEQAPTDASATQDAAEEETVVDVAPPESSFSLGALTDVVSPATLLLAVVLIIVILVTYWWYRKRSVKNVGTQFAHATDEDDAPALPDTSDEKKIDENVASNKPPGSVWSDDGGLPDSIDEYTASTPGADELDLGDAPEEIETSPAMEAATAIELDSDDSSPIRELSGEEIDYLGEADVHLAYGLYDEAASVLQRGIDENPGRADLRLKLLEVYLSGDMSDEFVTAAKAWQASGYAEESDWNKAVEMGREIAPDSELFGTADSDIGSPTEGQKTPATDRTPEVDLSASLDISESDSAADLSLPQSDDSAPAEDDDAAADEKAADDGLEFDLSDFDLGAESEVSGTPVEESSTETASAEDTDDSLDFESPDVSQDDDADTAALDLEGFDLGELGASEPEEASLTENSPEYDSEDSDDSLDIDLGELSLSDDDTQPTSGPDPDFDAPELEDSIESLTPAETSDIEESVSERLEPQDDDVSDDLSTLADDPSLDQIDDTPIADDPAIDAAPSEGDDEEVSVKLDLARAYMDMGEPEMAKALLDEVVEMGNEQQKQEAQDLISRA